jgi:hypothetical protein
MSRWAREGEDADHPSWQPAVQPLTPQAKRRAQTAQLPRHGVRAGRGAGSAS